MYQSKLEVEERKTLKPNLVFLINTDYTLRGGYIHEHTYTDTHYSRHAETNYRASSSCQDRTSQMHSYSISKRKAWAPH